MSHWKWGVLGLIFTLLTACQPGASQPETNAAQSESNSAEPVTLVLYNDAGGTQEEFDQSIGNEVKKILPNYTIKYIGEEKGTLEGMVTSGTEIDLFQSSIGNAAGSILNVGYQTDITELAQKSGIDLSRFEPSMLEAVKQFGGLYGLPINSGGLVLYYNKDLFDKFGVSYPKDGMTWDDAIELGKKLTRSEDGVQYMGLVISPPHLLRMNSYSLPVLDSASGQPNFGNPKMLQLLQTTVVRAAEDDGYRTVVRDKGLPANDGFSKQRNVAMYVMNYGLQNGKDFEGLNWDVVSLPTFKDLPGVGTQPYPNFMFISANSKKKEQAMEYIKALTSDAFQSYYAKSGRIPVLKSDEIKKLFATETAYKDKNVKNALYSNKYAAPAPKSKYDSLVERSFNKQSKNIILNNPDLNTVLATIQEDAVKTVEAEKKK
ncbi:Bacterial extracellular solute-binding protein [Paenibacillus konkukensis]|uniref:Bacterial extracellular solute-binding protein n=1 Tax=Paenibacillus konkukensis TaxID=2020716 RepID=A0ABY4RM72_9BACL|nr:extracellular solute-binding protein [Paenibacillus konkukensis]UQZ83466.1 Bacterial extracellular solute-binding protein [Paenibacillus konkukensis]